MMFRIATSPKSLGWSPAVFWSATMQELSLALEGLEGKFRSQPIVSREEIRRLAIAHGKKKSLRNDPRAVNFSERRA